MNGGILKTIKAFCGAIVAAFTGLHFMLQLLVYAIAVDIITGLIAAWAERKISSEISRRGMARKAIMIVSVAGAEVASKLTGAEITMPWGPQFTLGAALAGYYVIHEALSTTENISRAGVPLPKFLLRRLEQMKQIDEEL